MSNNCWGKLIPIQYTWEKHENTSQGQLWVLKQPMSLDSCLVFLGFSYKHSEFSHDDVLGLCPKSSSYPACYFSIWTSSRMYVWSRAKVIRKDKHPGDQPVRQRRPQPLFSWLSSSGPPHPLGFPLSSPVRFGVKKRPVESWLGLQVWVCRGVGVQMWVCRREPGVADLCAEVVMVSPSLRTNSSWLTCSELWKHYGGSLGLHLALQLLCHVIFCLLNGRVELESGKTL